MVTIQAERVICHSCGSDLQLGVKEGAVSVLPCRGCAEENYDEGFEEALDKVKETMINEGGSLFSMKWIIETIEKVKEGD